MMKLLAKLFLPVCMLFLPVGVLAQKDDDVSGKPLFGIGLHGVVTGYDLDALNTELVANGLGSFTQNVQVRPALSLSLFKGAFDNRLFSRIELAHGRLNATQSIDFHTTLDVWQFTLMLAQPITHKPNAGFYAGAEVGYSAFNLKITEVERPLESFSTAMNDLTGTRSLNAATGIFISPMAGFDFSLKRYPDLVFSITAGYRFPTAKASWFSFGRTVSDAPALNEKGFEGSFGLILF